ncbi:15468_t:CDS:2 [Funneliformis mosseae]|uniref:15468_t:CDS:1 n=1 Tax=Funneliformis mosseae TaxID=27381 RepID=A0A9N9DM74_FUNMO|nr:15468_t:CDS:2 [Funneliformis mosseae]
MRIIRRNLSTNLFSLLFAIILCVFPLYTTAQNAKVRIFAHEETIDYGPKSLPRIWKQNTYDDGTAVVRIIRRNPAIQGPVCLIEKLFLRIIHLDGTVDEKDLDLGIQPFNYCLFQSNNLGVDGQTVEFIDYYLIRKNQILVTYHNATDINDYYTYEEWGMVIDFDGNVKSRTLFGFAFVAPATQIITPNTNIKLNINREKGFLRIATVRNTTNAEWQQYRVELDGTITKLTSGMLEFDNFKSLTQSTISTVDEGYAIVYAKTSDEGFKPSDPLSPLSQLFYLYIGYNQYPVAPLTLYQTTVPNVNITSLYCGIASIGVGQVCTLAARQIDTATSQVNTFYVMVNFLSSGSVSSFKVINRLFPAIENTVNKGIDWVVASLSYGGYLLTNTIRGTPGTLVYGFLFGDDDANYVEWDLEEPQPSNTRGAISILNNNTLMLAQFETANAWSFNVIDLPKFSDRDSGYANTNVEATSPSIQSFIDPDSQKTIRIDFYDQIELSNGNISIFQFDGNDKKLRQIIPGNSCTLENESKSITAYVLDSTFSLSNANYFITMDNNFVKNKAYKEPLLGIGDNIWTFSTTEGKKQKFASSTSGLVRLTVDGTKVYDSLSSEDQDKFFNTLLIELADSIPVSPTRFHSNKKIQPDNTLKDNPYFISIGIEETEGGNEKSVDSIIKILETMIKYKDQTPIGIGEVSKYLDASYGFNPKPDLWETYKYRLLGVFLVVGLLIILFLFAQKRDKAGNNFAILQLGLILFDLIMDVLFVSNNSRDIPSLYIPSVIFVTLPIGLNTILAFYIITKENAVPEFYKWFTNNGKVASVFTLLSGADIEALNILQSNLAGLPFFQAPFSDGAKSKIFWSACLNVFIEDFPQVIIQIYYRINTVTYDIIPLLTLISSTLNLIVNIIGRLYQATNRVRHGKNKNSYTSDEEFGGLDNKKVLEKLEGDKTTSREVPNSVSERLAPNYLGDVSKLDNAEGSSNNSNSNLGNDFNKNQNTGKSFFKRMVNKKV